MKTRLHPLDKPFFLESVNQKWACIFVGLGIAVFMANAYGLVRDPAPYLGYFTGIGVSFILGASGSDVMKAYKVDSYNVTGTPNLQEFTPDPKDCDDYSVR